MKSSKIFKLFYLCIMLMMCGTGFAEVGRGDNSDVEIGSIHTEDVDISAATALARKTVDDAIAVLISEKSASRSFAVKVSIADGDLVEHIWLTNIRFSDGQFTGVIGNPPRLIRNVKIGRLYTVEKDEILDWMYIREGEMVGNYTLKALFPHMNPVEVKMIKQQVGWL